MNTEPTCEIGVSYFNGKRKPWRAFTELNGNRKDAGWFTTEGDAWRAARDAMQERKEIFKAQQTQAEQRAERSAQMVEVAA